MSLSDSSYEEKAKGTRHNLKLFRFHAEKQFKYRISLLKQYFAFVFAYRSHLDTLA